MDWLQLWAQIMVISKIAGFFCGVLFTLLAGIVYLLNLGKDG